MTPHDMGTLFDECAEAGVATTVVLDRPFDIAPDGGTRWSVPELAALVREASGWLAAAGARPGSRVAIVKDNHWDYDLLACAAVRIGAVPAQISAHIAPAGLATLLERIGPDVLVTTGGLLRAGAADGIDLSGCAGTVLRLGPGGPGGPGEQLTTAVVTADDLRGSPPPPVHRRRDDDPLVINHTSGTTGLPKLVVHTTRTIIMKLARFEARPTPVIGCRSADTVATASSYAHGRTFCWTGVALAMAPRTVVVLTGQDPDAVDPVLRAHPPTIVEATPAAFVRYRPLTERLDNPFRNVRLYISTYDALHPPVIRSYLHASAVRRPLFMQGWGQTETGPLTFRFHTRRSSTPAGARHPDTRNLGRPIPVKTRLRVVDPGTFEPVRRGEPGLVLARTAALCRDYLGESERYRAKLVGGWWNTGDLGTMGRDGHVTLLDREVDRVPELSCLEVEDVVEDRVPAVVECVVLGAPGEKPLPVVVTADGTLDERQWTRAVADLPALRDPVVLAWDAVPRTGTGKVRRLALAETLTGQRETSGSGLWT